MASGRFRQRLERLDDRTIYRRGRPSGVTTPAQRAYRHGFFAGFLPFGIATWVLTIVFDLMGAWWLLGLGVAIVSGAVVATLNSRRVMNRDAGLVHAKS